MKLNAALTYFWLAMVPISVGLGWVEAVAYVAALSIYALVAAHLSTYAAARTEVLQSDADKKLQETLELVHEALKRLEKLDPDHPRDDM
jgi:hypothetical protein